MVRNMMGIDSCGMLMSAIHEENGDGTMIVYEMSDDKFIFNLCNFEKFPEFEMNNIFDVTKKNYTLVTGIHGGKGSFHESLALSHLYEDMLDEE